MGWLKVMNKLFVNHPDSSLLLEAGLSGVANWLLG